MAHRLVALLRSQPAPQIRSRAAVLRGALIRFQAIAVAMCFLIAIAPVAITVFRQTMPLHYDD
jgi:hypothetical protein